jgi:hypothetical protein
MRVYRTKLREVLATLEATAELLNGASVVGCSNVHRTRGSCLMRQGERRALSPQREHRDYDRDQMCGACRALWHVDESISSLRDIEVVVATTRDGYFPGASCRSKRDL